MAKKKQKKSTKKGSFFNFEKAEVKGWLLLLSAILVFVSVISFGQGQDTTHLLGLSGYFIGWLATALFGLAIFFPIFYAAWLGWRLLFNKPINKPLAKHFHVTLLVLSFCMLLSVLEEVFPSVSNGLGSFFYAKQWSQNQHFHLGGAPFHFLYRDIPAFNMNYMFNAIGVTLIFGSLFMWSLFYLTKANPKKVFENVSKIREQLQKSPEVVEEQRFVKLRTPTVENLNQELMVIQPEKNLQSRPSLSRKEKAEEITLPTSIHIPDNALKKREAALTAQKVYNGDFKGYIIPQMNLLTDPKKVDQSSLKKDLRRQAEVLEETLHSFGIDAKVGQINCGPTITSFEVHPAIGVKVQKIKALENDIALNMEAKSIRILAPIPGKAAIGIEVPNPQPQEVSFKEMLAAYNQAGKKFQIPLLLGKTVSGEYLTNDLTKMPHCIIAGATGSGKSVCINSIVMSILMTAKPDEIKLIMVDPKKVELTPYTNLPHMLAPVITEPAGACAALSWLVKEMETRYEIMKRVGQRNILGFNSREVNETIEKELGIEIPNKMYYIVCIIDELADLMMVSNNTIETHIARIAQMARAVGIHLILATQRPSREVITGIIKANFPTRIAFKVASRVNSQIILDEIGAESLLGNGDLLFLPPASSHLMRAQGAFVRDVDINAVVSRICEQSPPNYLIKSFDEMIDMGEDSFSPASAPKIDPADSLYDQALSIVLSTGNASTTYLQRKLKIGYARAASIIDELETNGIVGPADGAKPRKVLANIEDQ